VANYRRDGDARRSAEARYAAEPPPDAAPPGADAAVEEEWRSTVLAEALRRLRSESNPVHYAVFHASAIENLPTDAILRIHPVTPANLYQIRRRLSARLRALLPAVRQNLESGPSIPPPRDLDDLPRPTGRERGQCPGKDQVGAIDVRPLDGFSGA
jgi:hypothetical protein